jgi:ankyrin repeat protein
MSLLLYAVESDKEAVVKSILRRPNVDLSIWHESGVTPLTAAIERKLLPIAQCILSHPALSVLADTQSISPMWAACRSGYTLMVKEILRWNFIDINQRGPDGVSPLQAAITGQHWSIVRLLCHQDRIAINDRGPEGWTALTFAAAAGQAEIVAQLLGYPHIDVNAIDNQGRRPLWWAINSNHAPTIQILMKDPRTPRIRI